MDDLLTRIGPLPQLRALSIGHAPVSGKAIAHAARRQPQLSDIACQYCQLADSDIKELESLVKLDRVELTGCTMVTSSAIDSLRKALPTCKIVSDHGTFEPLTSDADRRATE